MVRTSGLLALLATATSAVIAEDTAAIPQALPGAYIIEFADGHVRAMDSSGNAESSWTQAC